MDACNAGERQICLDAADLAFAACDFAEDDLGVEMAKRACNFGAPKGCLAYGTLLFTRLPAPHEKPDAALGRTTLMGVCNGTKPGMASEEAEVRRAACDRLSVRLADSGDAEWETYATKACELGRIDACVRLAAKVQGPPYLAELTKLCLKPEAGDAKLIGAPLLERDRDPNRLLRVCAEVLTKRDATFVASAEGKAVRQRARSLDATGLLGFYLGTDPAPDADPSSLNDRLVMLGSAACSMGDDHACVTTPVGEPGSGTCTLLTPAACSNWAKELLTPHGTEATSQPRAERIATRACALDDHFCDALGRVIQIVRPKDVVLAKEAFSRACRAGNPAACREGAP
ncbi:MAG: hypothetical protein ABIO72_02545 [Patescibacteria group bacterium]